MKGFITKVLKAKGRVMEISRTKHWDLRQSLLKHLRHTKNTLQCKGGEFLREKPVKPCEKIHTFLSQFDHF